MQCVWCCVAAVHPPSDARRGGDLTCPWLSAQALVDRPDEVRRVINFKRLAITDLKVDIPRLAKKSVLKEALATSGARSAPLLTPRACAPSDHSPAPQAGGDSSWTSSWTWSERRRERLRGRGQCRKVQPGRVQQGAAREPEEWQLGREACRICNAQHSRRSCGADKNARNTLFAAETERCDGPVQAHLLVLVRAWELAHVLSGAGTVSQWGVALQTRVQLRRVGRAAGQRGALLRQPKPTVVG